MSRVGPLNALAVLGCVTASVLAAGRAPAEPTTTVTPRDERAAPAATALRIASASTVADRLLFDLCPHGRVIAVTERSASGPEGYRFEGRPTLRSLEDLEPIVALHPDVLVAGAVGDPRRAARVREAGIEVVEVGSSLGVATLLEDIRRVARLCGVPDGGEAYAAAFQRRMAAVARDVPERARKPAIYLSIYGDHYFGGTTPSTYHDVLTAAGLVDAAADGYRGYPQYAIEQLLALDPEIIVSRDGMRDAICTHAILSRLRACHDGRVVEIDGDLLDEPGPSMLDAAEAIHEAVYAR
ncbi:MAG: ABC transporter substrate-binding protein [Sandaracinaceae bacterium]